MVIRQVQDLSDFGGNLGGGKAIRESSVGQNGLQNGAYARLIGINACGWLAV